TGTQRSCRQLAEKFTQLCGRLELRHRIELLEGTGKRVRETPHCARRELGVLRLKIQAVHLRQQTARSFKPAVDESRIEDELGAFIGDLGLSPAFDLALHRFEVALNAIDSDSKRIDQVEVLAVLRKNRRKVATEGHVRTDENADACGHAQAQRFVVRVANADRKATSVHLGFEIKYPKHLHAIV